MEQSDLGLHCLPRPICSNNQDHYGWLFKYIRIVKVKKIDVLTSLVQDINVWTILFSVILSVLIIPPRKLCLWEGILFSRCPSVRSSVTFCFLNIFKSP